MAVKIGLVGLVVASIGVHAYKNQLDPRPPAARQSMSMQFEQRKRIIETQKNWKRVCQWIAEHTPSDAIFVTPYSQQTFKWYAGRAEVVNWKDMPQDARSVVHWRRRLDTIYPYPGRQEFGVLALLNSELLEIAQKHDASYLLVEQRYADQREMIDYPIEFEQVYPAKPNDKTTFVVFKFPDE